MGWLTFIMVAFTCSENITPVLVGVLDLLFVELDERLLAHVHAVDDVPGIQLDLGLEHDRRAGAR